MERIIVEAIVNDFYSSAPQYRTKARLIKMLVKIPKLKVLNDNVLIKRDPLPESKVGSIYLPDRYAGIHHKVQDRGKILAVGDKVKNKDIKVGIRVIFGRFSYQDFERGKDTILVRECDCLAIGEGV